MKLRLHVRCVDADSWRTRTRRFTDKWETSKGEKKEELTESLAGGGGGDREEEEEEEEMQSIRFSDGQVDFSGLAANQVS